VTDARWIYEGRCPESHATVPWRPLASCAVCLGTGRVSFETAADVYGTTALFQTRGGRVTAKRVESTTAPRYDDCERQAHSPAIGQSMPNKKQRPLPSENPIGDAFAKVNEAMDDLVRSAIAAAAKELRANGHEAAATFIVNEHSRLPWNRR